MSHNKRLIFWLTLLLAVAFAPWDAHMVGAVDSAATPTTSANSSNPEQTPLPIVDKESPTKPHWAGEGGEPTMTLVSIHKGPFQSQAAHALKYWPILMLIIIVFSIFIYWLTIRKSLLAYWH